MSIKDNPKKFWKYVKSKTRFQHKIADLVNQNGTACTLDNEKAEELNKTFANVFSVTSKNDLISTLPNFPVSYSMDVPDISQELMLIKINALNEHKAWGPDDINPQLLKECANEIKLPLQQIFTRSIIEGEIPADWKKANVTPIFKKGERHKPDNYRPISLTSVVCKLL